MENLKFSNFKEVKTTVIGLFLMGLNVYALINIDDYSFTSFLVLLVISVGFIFSPNSVIDAIKKILENGLKIILRNKNDN